MGELIVMLLCALIPAALLVLYVRHRDHLNPEPWGKMIKGVFLGVLSVPLVLLIHEFWDPIPFIVGYGWIYDVPVLRGIMEAFYNAAIPEEVAKLIMLWLLLRKNSDFDESMDGIVYAVCVGMGFAGLENIQYIFDEENAADWGFVAFTRALLAVPGHYIDAVLMGFFYSIVHFHPKRYGKYKICILLVPVISHGIYDGICMAGEEILDLLLYVPLIWFSVKMHKFCLARIKNIELIDEDEKDLKTFAQAMKSEELSNEDNKVESDL